MNRNVNEGKSNHTANENDIGLNHGFKNNVRNGIHRYSKEDSLNSIYSVPLLHRKDIPSYLQFNPYIDKGYRPLLSFRGCVLSILYAHNETVNVLTHGIPMLYILIWWQSLIPWSEISVPFLPWIHLVSAVSPWIGSTIYHLFMNHRSGAGCYRVLLHVDMFGIWITQSFGALTTVYASISCQSSTWIWRILLVYCFVSLWCLYKALTAVCAMSRRLCFSMALVMQFFVLSWRIMPFGGGHPKATFHYFLQANRAKNAWDRRFCYTFPILMRAAAVTLRCYPSGGGHPDAFRHVILQDLTAIIGGFVGALRIPEKWFPGRLDYFANSHHIMHVLVVYAVYHLHQGAILDMLWLSKTGSCKNVQPLFTN